MLSLVLLLSFSYRSRFSMMEDVTKRREIIACHDGETDIAVYWPSDGYWYILRSLDGGVTQRP